MLRRTRRRARSRAYSAKSSKKKSSKEKTVSGPAMMVLATVPPRPKGYLTYQKGNKLIAKKMNRKGGKGWGRRKTVCVSKKARRR